MPPFTLPITMLRLRDRWLAVATGALFFAAECFRYFGLLRHADDARLVKWVPDDAFYYLILGRNFTLVHRWTFDGVAPATGFHLLWGYTVALIYWIAPNSSLHQIFALLFFLAALLLAMSLAFLCALVSRLFGPFSVLGPIAIFAISVVQQLPNFLMESSVVVFSSCLAVWVVLRGQEQTRGKLAAAFAIGLLGMLSRSDFGLLPFMMFVVYLATYRKIKAPPVSTAGIVLLGSIAGLAIVLGHSYLVSGHLAQSSVLVKHRWSSADDDYYSGLGDLAKVSSSSSASAAVFTLFEIPELHLWWWLPCIFLCGLLLIALKGAEQSRLGRRPALATLWAMGSVILGYIALYANDGSVQRWYFANYVAPYSVLAASAFAIPARAWRTVLTVAVAAFVSRLSVGEAIRPIWPQQIGFYAAGLYLRDHPELKPVGAWNAGITSYVASGGVINVDGLVNDDAAQYAISNSLRKYLSERHIYRVIDDAIMWDSALTRSRGGYAGDSLTRCVDSKVTLWQVAPSVVVGNHLVLSTLDPQCLNSYR